MNNPLQHLAADASAIINLNASQCAPDILRALPERLVVVDIVVSELDEGRKTGRSDAEMLEELIKAGLIERDSLGELGETLFERLVAGSAAVTLDDGEAATIAYAVEHSIGIILDDQKARRICGQDFSQVAVRSSVDLFRHAQVQQALAPDRLRSAVLSALRTARMRVLSEHVEWVRALIGDENARSCRSLPQCRPPGC